MHGRSMCPNCKHQLSTKDLVPVLSWLWLKGCCRYCRQPISWQYPLVELMTAALFVASYIFWPYNYSALFIFWLIFLVGFMVLTIYDLRWMLLPNRIVYPLVVLAVLQTLIVIVLYGGGLAALMAAIWGLLIVGGLFYGLFQVSKGRWIGGGDVKLGVLLGIIVGGPANALLLLFLASLTGCLVSIPLLLTGRATRTSRLPFGPFLMLGAAITYLFGPSIISWYQHLFLLM